VKENKTINEPSPVVLMPETEEKPAGKAASTG
jgi:hypothetical protein